MKQIYLWGSGDGAIEVLHILEDLELYQVCGVVSRHKPEYESLKAYPFFNANDPSYKENIKNTSSAVVTVGDPYLRERMLEEIEEFELQLPVLIHPSTVVAKDCVIEKGCVIGPQVTISSGVEVKENCYISFNASVGHHSVIGKHSVISPGTRIGGSVECGHSVFTGLNAVVVPRVKIGNGSILSAGSLLTKSTNDNVRVIAGQNRMLQI